MAPRASGAEACRRDAMECDRRPGAQVGPALFTSLLIITSLHSVFTLEAQEGRLFSPCLHQDLCDGRRGRARHHADSGADGLSHPCRIPEEKKNPLNRALIALYRPLLERRAGLSRPRWPSRC